MVFSNIDIGPQDSLQYTEAESTLWIKAQTSLTQRVTQTREVVLTTLPHIPGGWCFTDGSWKDQDNYSGQGWYSTLAGFDRLMRATNTRASLSLLHSELEVLIWTIESMRNLRKFHVAFATDCSQLVKMILEPKEWPAFATYLEDIQILKESFSHSRVHTCTPNEKYKDEQSGTQCSEATIFRGSYRHKVTCSVRKILTESFFVVDKKKDIRVVWKQNFVLKLFETISLNCRSLWIYHLSVWI